MNTQSVTSRSLEETQAFAKSFLSQLTSSKDGAMVVCLDGDLGSGKTALVKEIGEALGLNKDLMTSPTFVIEKLYPLKTLPCLQVGKNLKLPFTCLVHIDAYRLEESKELSVLGFEKLLEDRANIIFIEWPERVAEIIPDSAITIECKFLDESTREYRIRLNRGEPASPELNEASKKNGKE
jgi:tRNA threonylcarbamoyladenosine biosynthesis protein TsaE